LEAACQADHVFATGHLLDLLDIHSIERSAFSDFYDLQRQIRLL
jgi:2-hydroxy-3-keto-5-methylthiopentenyl-1-phosphate phosphatase